MALFASSARPQAVPGLDATVVASGLTSPVFVTAPPGDYNRLFIVQQGGVIRILDLTTPSPSLNPTPFLDIHTIVQSGGEQGLLGLAFDPNYFTNGHPGKGKFYVYIVVPGGTNGITHISQFHVSAGNADVADTTETVLQTLGPPPASLTFDHPQTNHNAGWIGFSPRSGDAYNLYIATGDGGNGDDQGAGHHEPGGNAQWNQTLLGKMLRVHVDPATATYTIPGDNPFASSLPPIMKEIWLLGLRNPYRDSFDRLTGRMFIGDVGQSSREEIDVQQPTNPGGGENYGWRDREGFIQNPTYATATPTPTPVPPRVDPILDYPRSLPGPTPCNGIAGRTVIGGYVYRGKQIPALKGTYVFGDYLGPSGCTAKVFTLDYDGVAASNAQDITSQLFPTIDNPPINLANPSSFGEDANGELYITDIGNGSVYKIVPVAPYVAINSITRNPITGHNLLQGTGVPFKIHTVQASPDLIQSFVTIGTATAGGDGNFQFDDANASSFAKRFYRVTYP
jgi:glucose/arabinose dehydrogenase